MSPEPTAETGRTAYDPAPVVAKYWALVSHDVIASDLSLLAGADDARPKLAGAAPWAAHWPPRPVRRPGLSGLPAHAMALARLKALFDFGAQVPDEEVGDIAKHARVRWPETARTGTVFERIMVTAVVRADGDAEWGYERTGDGGEPLPIEATAREGKRPELDLYLQNLVRADIESRLVAYA